MSILRIENLDLFNKRVLIRLDLNVPMKNGRIISDKRIKLSLPTIKYSLKKGARVILFSHLGRPIEGIYDKKYSLLPIVKYLNKCMKLPVRLIYNYLNKENIFNNFKNEILVLENVRFNIGETKNNNFLSKKYASLCDIFVMDAFATAHRKNSSTYGIINFAKISCIGLLFYSEIKYLSKVLSNPVRPMISIVGGAKISTKFNVLNKLAKISDTLIVGGGISNTFIAIDHNVGKSLYEPSFVKIAKKLRNKYNIPIPVDCRVGKKFSESSLSYTKNVCNINNDEEIMDYGDNTAKLMSNIIIKSKTILWNGPVGVFEFPNFRKGTEIIINAIINSGAFVIAGGGDTISAIELFGVSNKISYISSGGGSFLKFIEGKKLPVISILEKIKYNFK